MAKQWDIYFLDLNPVVGSEQSGYRPAIIVSSDYVNPYLNQVSVLPITTFKKGTIIYPNEAFLTAKLSKLPEDSIALAHEIRSVDKKRFIKYVSNITDSQTIR